MAASEQDAAARSVRRLATLAIVVLAGSLMVAGLWVIWRIRVVLVTVLLAVVLAYLLKPVVDFLSSLRLAGQPRLSRFGASLIAFALLLFVLGWVVVLLTPSITSDLADLQARWALYKRQVPAFADRVQHLYQEGMPPGLRRVLDRQVSAASDFLGERAQRVLGVTFKGLGLLVELFLVPILAFYFISDVPSVKEGLLFFVPARWRTGTDAVLRDVDQVFNRYIQAQLLLCFIAFVVVTVGLYAVGMDFYLTLGLLAGVTRAIPVIGPIVGGIPIVALGLFRSPGFGLWLLVAFSALHIVESKYLMPRVLGFHLGIHPVVIILSLLFGYEFFGIIGMFIAVPVVAVIQRIVARYRETEAPAAPTSESA